MKREDIFGSIFVVFLVIGAAVGGVVMVYTGVRDVALQHEAQSTWRQAQGRVVKTTVNVGERFKGKAAILNLFYQEYRVASTYAYEVDGFHYLGSHIAPPGADSDRGRQEWAEETAAQFQPKQPCDVYYDPDNPGQAYLLRGTTSNVYGRILIGLFLVLLFGLILPGAFVLDLTAKWGLLPQPRGLRPTEQEGWYELLPASGERVRSSLGWAVLLTLVWDAGVGLTCWHYFVEGVRPLRWGYVDLVLLVIAGLLACFASIAILAALAESRRRRRILFPARVYLQSERLVPGTTVVVCVEQAVRESVRVKEFTATLVEVATGNKQAFVQLADKEATAEEALLGDGDLVFGETTAPTLARIDVVTKLEDDTCAESSFTFWSPSPLLLPAEEKSESEAEA